MEDETQPEATETEAAPESEPETTPEAPPAPNFAPGLRPIALLAHAGREPEATLTDEAAQAAWVAATAPWHPALLARAEALPRIEDVDTPSPPEPRDLRLVAEGVGT